MKKLLLLSLVSGLLLFSGCEETKVVATNINNSEVSNNTVFGTDALVCIGNGLWYDSTTLVVYWWNGCLGKNEWYATRTDTTPSPYYAPNGLPYRYNPQTNAFEEIER